jgi:hypothetical protein
MLVNLLKRPFHADSNQLLFISLVLILVEIFADFEREFDHQWSSSTSAQNEELPDNAYRSKYYRRLAIKLYKTLLRLCSNALCIKQ